MGAPGTQAPSIPRLPFPGHVATREEEELKHHLKALAYTLESPYWRLQSGLPDADPGL